MNHLQFAQRERRRIWQERFEIALGVILMCVTIVAVLVLCLVVDQTVSALWRR